MPPRVLAIVSLDESSVKIDTQLSPRLLPWAEGIGIIVAVIAGVVLVRRLVQAVQGRRERAAATAQAGGKAGNMQGMDFKSHRSLDSNGSSSISVDIGTAFDDNIEAMTPQPQPMELVPPSLRGQELMF